MSIHDRRLDRLHATLGREPCWMLPNKPLASGYVRLHVRRGVLVMAHRYAYERFRGPVPDGLELDHLCRNRSCCNPWHLDPVTHRTNLLRGDTIIAAQMGDTCKRGHPWTGPDADVYVSPAGKRQCWTCVRERKGLVGRYQRNR